METIDIKRPVALTELGQGTLRRLVRAWFEFERRLAIVPIVRRLDLGTFTHGDYQRLLLNLRPQVVEGSRWISRCASSFDRDHADIRSVVLRHAHDEHRDYEILESDYVATGGNLKAIREQPKKRSRKNRGRKHPRIDAAGRGRLDALARWPGAPTIAW